MSGLPRSHYLMRPKFLSRHVFAHSSATAFLIFLFHLTGFLPFQLAVLAVLLGSFAATIVFSLLRSNFCCAQQAQFNT
jgi:hypothetical protein